MSLCDQYWMILVNPILLVLQTLHEPFFKKRKLRDEISDGVHESIIRSIVRGGLDPQNHFVLHGVRILVSSKKDIWVLQ